MGLAALQPMFESINLSDLGHRSNNDIDLWYSSVFMYSLSQLSVPVSVHKTSTVSIKSCIQSHWVSTRMGGITVDYKTLILSTQFKQDKVHRSDSPHCNPTQSSSETLPVFSLQCFQRNGWNHSGLRNFNPFRSVLLPTGMSGNLKTPSSCTV